MWTRVTRVSSMFLPEDGPYEAEHVEDYNNMYTVL